MPNALAKVNNKADLESELQSLYDKQTETKNQIEQLQKKTYAARRKVNRFELEHQNKYREFFVEDLDEYSLHLYREKQKAADDLQAELERVTAELPKIEKDIEYVNTALSEKISVPVDEIIAQQKAVADLQSEVHRIHEAIHAQQELHRLAKQSREENAAEIESQRQELLAKQALGEVDDPQAFKTVAGMADTHYEKSDQEIAQIQSAIAGLQKRLDDVKTLLSIEHDNLDRLKHAFYEGNLRKTLNQYEKKAKELHKLVNRIHGHSRYLGRNAISKTGSFDLPGYVGMSCYPKAYIHDRDIRPDEGANALQAEFQKLGIIDE
ncbi:MAG: hypothetical protein JAY97_11485 [Candidatus Thiodiazotropha sp. 'RUGA']|nr:hypothetical protein [Candidatus Thiodiazotropha sp. 'RUGA']